MTAREPKTARRRETRLPSARMFALVALAASCAGQASAQTLRGRVIDGSTEAAVGGAALVLVSPDSQQVGSTIADDDGRFSLAAPSPGDYMVRVERIGYTPTLVGPVRLRANGFAEVTLTMAAQPIPLDSVDVQVAGSQNPWLTRAGFYERKAHSRGTFIERAALAKRGRENMGDVLAGVQSVRIINDRGTTDIQLRGNMTGGLRNPRICLPLIYLDGLVVADGQTWEMGRFNLSSLSAEDVEAIEVYSGQAAVPTQFARGGGVCGAVLFWTRQR